MDSMHFDDIIGDTLGATMGGRDANLLCDCGFQGPSLI